MFPFVLQVWLVGATIIALILGFMFEEHIEDNHDAVTMLVFAALWFVFVPLWIGCRLSVGNDHGPERPV